jgi:glutathione S-transferase
MRARLAIAVSGVQCEIREVVLKDKPTSLLKYSPKGTVPVLITREDTLLEESLDIMHWALEQHDPHAWLSQLSERERADTDSLISNNDGDFKYWLDRYKYADRYPEHTELYYREQGEKTLAELEQRLSQQQGLMGDQWTLADIALLPFIRQFAFVDKVWFDQAPYPNVRRWLNDFLDSALFKQIMPKFAQWQEGDKVILFS